MKLSIWPSTPEREPTLILQPQNDRDRDLLERLITRYRVYFGRNAVTLQPEHVEIELEEVAI